MQILRDCGHDVLTSYEAVQANQGIPDPEVLILITFNRDDFIDLHRSGMNHSGIIICKDDRDYQGQAKFINDFLQAQTTELSDRLIRLSAKCCKTKTVSVKPVGHLPEKALHLEK